MLRGGTDCDGAQLQRKPTQLGALAALDVVQVVAVLGEELVVAGIEGQSVAARLQLGGIVVALPVLVARRVVRIEAKVVRALERLLGGGDCGAEIGGVGKLTLL